MDTIIVILIIVAVLGFFLWAFVQSNGFRFLKKNKKDKTIADTVSAQYSSPEKSKPARTLKVRKRNLEEDFKKNESLGQKKAEGEVLAAGGGKIEKVFTEKPQADRVVEQKPMDDESEFEKELDKLLFDLERENKMKRGEGVSGDASIGAAIPFAVDEPKTNADEFLADFDTDRYKENLEILRQKEIHENEPQKNPNFDRIFEDEVKKYNTSLNIVRESDGVVTKESNIEIGKPNFDKASFGERFKKVFDGESSKSNNVVVVGDKEKTKRAKESRKKWL